MRAKFIHEVAAAGLPTGNDEARTPVTDADIVSLPLTAQRYLRFMGLVGRPRVWSFRARWNGSFRRSLGEPWMPCEAWQYNSRLEIARIFHMRLLLRGFVPFLVRDTYVRGKGHMVGRIFDSFSVVDVGDDAIDVGELVTYLNDAILFAPSMLLGPNVVWSTVDERSFDVELADRGHTVRARVFVDERGAVTDFSTIDRYGADPAHPKEGMKRTKWTTPIDGWTVVAGRPMPTTGRAVWHFPSGDLPYAAFTFVRDDLELDVAPDAL